MLYPSLEPNERFRDRRAAARRRKRRRRAIGFGILLLLVLGIAGGMTLAKRSTGTVASPPPPLTIHKPKPVRAPAPRALPVEIRGVHVTGALASIPNRLAKYVGLTNIGLNTIELDVKDEGGIINFETPEIALTAVAGANRTYYDPKRAARLAHRKGVYLIGRVVVFQDPKLAAARPDLAIKRADGSIWRTNRGLGWVNPYDRRVWAYAVSVAEVAAKAGFDEIMLDYVRFPSDGDVANAVYPGRTSQPPGRVIRDFVAYAKRRLDRYGVRVSTALFGLSASQDLGIGQVPRLIAQHVDSISPMAYPVLYGDGQLGIARPSRQPGETVFRTMGDFRGQVKGDALLVPWIQDWDYAPEFVKAQVEAARLQGAKGFLLWNAEGKYTKSALAPP